MSSRRTSHWHTVGLVAWFVVLVVGFSLLAVYSNTPGHAGEPPAWSDDFFPLAERASGESSPYRLVMAIHPKCPCTRATISELERLIRKCGEGLGCYVLVYHPADAPPEWHETLLVSTARNLPQTQVVLDPDARLALQMNMKTSGAVVLYAQDGRAVFHGGITMARGHEGDNLGSDAVLSQVRNGFSDRDRCSVFGCPIQRPNAHGGESI